MSDAETAEETDGETAGNREVAGGESSRVFFGNLPWNTSWQDLKDQIKDAGFEPGYVDVIRDRKTGRSKGFGIASFITLEDAEACILKLNNTTIDGRQIYVKMDRPPPFKKRRSGEEGKKSENSPGDTQPDEEREKPVATSGRIFVGNLAWSVTWSELVAHMKQAGEVLYTEILTGVRDRSMGCALVEFKTTEQAQEALDTLGDTEINGRKIYLREDRESYWTVFINHIAPKMTWQELRDLCNEYGKVVRSDRNSKGYGTVRFDSEDDAKACIEGLNGKEHEGQILQVMFANEAGKYQQAVEEEAEAVEEEAEDNKAAEE